MLRKILLGLALGCAIGGAQAQTPSPADVGIVRGTPDVFKVLDHTNAWATFGSVDPITHVFTPVGGGGGGGSLTVNGITGTTGMTFSGSGVTVTGSTPNATITIPGGGTGGGGTVNAGVLNQIAAYNSTGNTVSGLNGPVVNVTSPSIGFVAGGADNVSKIPSLMAAMGPSPGFGYSGGYDVSFPPIQGQEYTDYYFSKEFEVSRGMGIHCGGRSSDGGDSSTRLIFAPGVDGVVFESGYISTDSGWGAGQLSNCGVVSLGFGSGVTAPSSNTISSVFMFSADDAGIPSSTWSVGDGIIAISKFVPENSSPAVPSGAYVSGVSGDTLTLATGFGTFATIGESNNVELYQLPATKKYTIRTTIGSNSMIITAGPSRGLRPGDMVWTDAFPGGATVISTTQTNGGATYPVTVTMGDIFITAATVPAIKTYTSGSPGQLWLMPAGLRRRVGSHSYNNELVGFPFGLEMDCSAGMIPTTGCNASGDYGNFIFLNLFGRFAHGDNTGASTSLNNQYGANFMADIAEDGTVGSSYVGENSNCSEAGYCTYGIVQMCAAQNYSVWVGGYTGNFNGHYICQNTDMASHPWGFPTGPGNGFGPLVIAPEDGGPPDSTIIEQGDIQGTFRFFQNPTIGGFGCAGFNLTSTIMYGFSTNSCEINNTWALGYNATAVSWDWNLWGSSPPAERWTFPATYDSGAGHYAGYNGSVPMLSYPPGILLFNDDGGDLVGSERRIDMGDAAPTGTPLTFHQVGDVRFNTTPVSGGNAGWIYTSTGYLPFGNIGSSSVCCGNVVQSDIPIGSAVSVTTGTPKTITSVSLTAGDWDCHGEGVTNAAASTLTTTYEFGLSTTNNVFSAGEAGGNNGLISLSGTVINAFAPVGTIRYNLGSTTTIYLIGQVNFSVSTMSVYGLIQCRQMG